MSVLHESRLIRVKPCRHGVMAFLLKDQHIGKSLDAYGEWAEAEIQLLSAVLKPGNTFVDVGSNIGTHTVAMAHRVGPGGAVYAFEPQGFIHQLLCTNVALNSLSQVRTFHAGLGATAGELTVPTLDFASDHNFGGLSLGHHPQGEKVQLRSLDSLELRQCHAVKIDVEGMEEQVISGATETLRAHRPVVYFENNRQEGAPGVVERLFTLGYSLFWHFSPFFRKDNYRGNAENVFGEIVDANAVAVPSHLAKAFSTLPRFLTADDTAQRAMERHQCP